jgi:hypothetical protein
MICGAGYTKSAADFSTTLHLFLFLTSCEEGENQQDATIRCLLLTSDSTCFGHHYAHLQEIKDRVIAYGVLRWFCWMWLVVIVGRCVVGCEQCYIRTYITRTSRQENSTYEAVSLLLWFVVHKEQEPWRRVKFRRNNKSDVWLTVHRNSVWIRKTN